MDPSNSKLCLSCGKEVASEDAFCTSCGTPVTRVSAAGAATGGLKQQLLGLKSEFLEAKELNPSRLEFSNEVAAKSPGKKIKIQYSAVADLDESKKVISFWEKLVEKSFGFSDAGFSFEKFSQKNREVSKEGKGTLLAGGKYQYNYGKLRQAVKSLADQAGWKFKLCIFKPKS